jgi:septal ring factor EnvC (AmiA/AmiB activator)
VCFISDYLHSAFKYAFQCPQALSAAFERDKLEEQLGEVQAELAEVQAAKEKLWKQTDMLESDKANLAQQVRRVWYPSMHVHVQIDLLQGEPCRYCCMYMAGQ